MRNSDLSCRAIAALAFASIIPFASLNAAEVKTGRLTIGALERSYIVCTSAAPVILYRVEGGGHRVPSREGVPFADILGTLNRDFDSAEVIWSFFKDRKRSLSSYRMRGNLAVTRAD